MTDRKTKETEKEHDHTWYQKQGHHKKAKKKS